MSPAAALCTPPVTGASSAAIPLAAASAASRMVSSRSLVLPSMAGRCDYLGMAGVLADDLQYLANAFHALAQFLFGLQESYAEVVITPRGKRATGVH